MKTIASTKANTLKEAQEALGARILNLLYLNAAGYNIDQLSRMTKADKSTITARMDGLQQKGQARPIEKVGHRYTTYVWVPSHEQGLARANYKKMKKNRIINRFEKAIIGELTASGLQGLELIKRDLGL